MDVHPNAKNNVKCITTKGTFKRVDVGNSNQVCASLIPWNDPQNASELTPCTVNYYFVYPSVSKFKKLQKTEETNMKIQSTVPNGAGKFDITVRSKN